MSKRSTLLVAAVSAALLLVSVPRTHAADTAGSVSGKIVFKGTPPPARTIPISLDTNVCGNEAQAEDLVVGSDKGIRYAVVRLIGATGTVAESTEPTELNQKGCKFAPHILVVRQGATLDILNNDGISHNIHSHSTANAEFNKAQPGFKKKMQQTFDKAERVRLSCDVHAWMNGWVVVADKEPVAITDAAGAFKLSNVPPGTYKLEVWHEKLGVETRDVTVKPGADATVTIELARQGS
jgi:plastocyanin